MTENEVQAQLKQWHDEYENTNDIHIYPDNK